MYMVQFTTSSYAPTIRKVIPTAGTVNFNYCRNITLNTDPNPIPNPNRNPKSYPNPDPNPTTNPKSNRKC